MQTVTIQLIKHDRDISYQGELLLNEAGHLLVRARWNQERLELGYISFERGDCFLEHYYQDEWFNIFEIRSPAQTLKGWYCNVTCPATFEDDVIRSEDLELDLFVSADGRQLLTLDQEEFEARGFDAVTYQAALNALEKLQVMARSGAPPFDVA